MTDYGRPVSFGVFPEPLADDVASVLSTVQQAERSGLDLVGIQDHPYQRRFLDTFALIAWLTARTDRIGFFTDVANLPLRPPAVLAKTAASLDLLGGGRFDLGLGAGGFWDAVHALGGPRRSPAESLLALAEAVEVIRRVWSGERGLRYDGDVYRLAGAHSGPVPTRPIGIWLGVHGPRALRLCGHVADGWVPSSGWAVPDRLPELSAQIDDAAVEAGRQPREVRRVYNVAGVITAGRSAGYLHGPVHQWVDELTDLVLEHGIDSFVLWRRPPEDADRAGDPAEQLRRYAEEVAPAVRAEVDRARAG
ncbi:MAG TPA: LLM class flavin-dependent oxidoreductase [Jiangellales bacterium]|nr:LLM class flavin-dependent oxidoreductase [Jiangellales bacterium]